MDDIRQTAIDRFRAYRAPAVLGAYRRELYPGSAPVLCRGPCAPGQISFREVDQFVERQHHHVVGDDQPAAQCAEALFCLLPGAAVVRGNPVKPSHFVRRGRPLPKALSREQVQRLFAQIAHPMDRALFLVILRCGSGSPRWPTSSWSRSIGSTGLACRARERAQRSTGVHVARCRGQVQQCLEQHPGERAQGYVFESQTCPAAPLGESDPKKMERYAKAAGITASCHSLRHTFAPESPRTRGRSWRFGTS